MASQWEVDLDIPDFGAMFTMLATSVSAAVMGAAGVTYTMLWVTAAYVRNGKDFFLDLLYATGGYTWTAEFVFVAGSLVFVSSIMFFIAMSLGLRELVVISKDSRDVRGWPVFLFFFLGLAFLVLALVSAILLKYTVA